MSLSHPPNFVVPFLVSLTASARAASAQAAPRPQPYCIQNVVLERGKEEAPAVTLLVRDGAIEALLDPAAPVPPGTRVVDGTGLLCLPAFVDAYTRRGCTTPQPRKDQDVPPDERADVGIDTRQANRKGIQPAFRAVEALAVSKEHALAWRESGWGAAAVSPGGELLAGASALVATREAAMRDIVLGRDVFACAAFAANGPGYPSTLMGYQAQLRQFLLDARHQQDLVERDAAGRPGSRPPFDAELDAGREILSGARKLLCEAQSANDIERWLALAEEFDLEVGISGGLEAWRIADRLAALDVPVILTLDWGKEPKDPRPKKEEKAEEKGEEEKKEEPEQETEAPASEKETPDSAGGKKASKGAGKARKDAWDYEEPLAVRLERRLEWERGRDCAQRLHEAGVRFAFGTGNEQPKELLGRVRTLVEHGLPAEAALAALTVDAAEVLGAGARLGRIAVGHDATFALWDGDPLTDKKARCAWIFVDGFPTEFEKEEEEEKDAPAEGIDVTGTWTLEFQGDEEGPKEARLTLEMEKDGAVKGKIEMQNPMDGSEIEAEVEGSVSGKELTLNATLSFGEFEFESEYKATIEGDALQGEATTKTPFADEPMTRSFTGKREPEHARSNGGSR